MTRTARVKETKRWRDRRRERAKKAHIFRYPFGLLTIIDLIGGPRHTKEGKKGCWQSGGATKKEGKL